MNHYVYELQNKEDKRKYIGVRSCKCSIESDPYMSSCKVVSKEYLKNCTKKVLKTFTTREEAVKEEIRLHNLYDVGINKDYFNGAKQTATKFDQSGMIYSSLNPNANIINIYDHNGVKQMTLNGDLTTIEDFPRNAFAKSHKNHGLPLGYSFQSRVELRKRIHQKYIGWYALKEGDIKKQFTLDCDPEQEQKIGLFSKLKFGRDGSNNSNAKTIDVCDPEGNIIFSSTGTFAKSLKEFGIPKSLAEKAKKTGKPIYTTKPGYQHFNGITVTIRKKE